MSGRHLIYNFDNNGTPLIICGADMSIFCSQASGFGQDISGQYLLFDVAIYNRWQIMKIDFSENRLVETGASFSLASQPYFSLDDRLMFALSYQVDGSCTIGINGFNPQNGFVTPGGQVTLGATLWNIFVAERD